MKMQNDMNQEMALVDALDIVVEIAEKALVSEITDEEKEALKIAKNLVVILNMEDKIRQQLEEMSKKINKLEN